MKEFNPYEGPKRKKAELGSCNYELAYLFLIGYLQDNKDKVFSSTDWNFVNEFLVQNCGM